MTHILIMPERKRVVTQISALESLRTKTMWSGARNQVTSSLPIYTEGKAGPSMPQTELSFTPAWFKMVDEITVNAIDHYVNYPNKVRNIDFKFDPSTGQISIRNDGPGIEIEEKTTIEGKKMLTPEFIASVPFTSDNHEVDEKTRRTGGINGVGMCLTNALSSEFIIDTTDAVSKQNYRQRFEDQVRVIHKPKITKSRKSPSTEFTFTPVFDKLDIVLNDDSKATMASLIKTRALQTAVYTKCTVTYNGEPILHTGNSKSKRAHTTKFKEYCQMHLSSDHGELVHCHMPYTDDNGENWDWEVCVGVSDSKFRSSSLINGINVFQGGTHIKHLKKMLLAYLKPKVEALFKKHKVKTKVNSNWISNSLYIFMMGPVNTPKFNSQIKAQLENPIKTFAPYVFKATALRKIWTVLTPAIEITFLAKNQDTGIKRVKRGIMNIKHCVDAKHAGSKAKSHLCTMLLCEGASAAGSCHTGIVDRKTKQSYQTMGMYNLNGFPPNALKETKKVGDVLIRSSMLQKNERIGNLVKVLGLDYTLTYETKEERANLRYGRVVLCTDADADGLAIAGLCINFFIRFWPALVRTGFVYRLSTPIIRLYPKSVSGKILEFKTQHEYEAWRVANPTVEAKYKAAKYVKGIGSNTKREMIHIFQHFEENIRKYTLDDEGLRLINVCYGDDTGPRKILLATPVDQLSGTGPELPVSEQCNVDTKEFGRVNIIRKLPSAIDGMAPSRRKILFLAKQRLDKKETKVAVFAAQVSSEMNYHHGETSLANTITLMGQDFPGSNNFNLLRPLGNFGTRVDGGKNPAAARYIYTKLNSRLVHQLYPPVDDYILDYEMIDGARCEPYHMVPIIPTALMENMHLPATGWKILVWARDIKDIFNNVRKLIIGRYKHSKGMKLFTHGHKGRVVHYMGKDYSVGCYELNRRKNQVIITELPMGVFGQQFIGTPDKKSSLAAKTCWKDPPFNETNDDGVKITFTFSPGEMEKIEEKPGVGPFDCWEVFFKLKSSLHENLNMLDAKRQVVEYKSHADVLDTWFAERKRLYAVRIDREITLTSLMILYLKNVIRFTSNHQSYNISPRRERASIDAQLAEEKYDRFDKSLLMSPKYTDYRQLKALILNADTKSCSYNYLVNDLPYGQMIKSACDQREKKLKELKKKLKGLKLDCGGKVIKGGRAWLTELAELEKTIDLGLSKGWDYGKKEASFN